MSGGPGGQSGTNAACAACKHQRRKCSSDCPLAPYFPPDQPRRFHNVHKLYGVSNVLRILRTVDPSKRDDAMKSIVFEADTREKDPVHGCLGVISLLQSQTSKLKEELALARDQLHRIEQQKKQQQQQHAVSILNQSLYGHHPRHQRIPASVAAHHQQLQQQCHGSTSHANFHDSTTQANSFDAKSLQPAYHDHIRYSALESTPLHDMFGHQLKVEVTDNDIPVTSTSTLSATAVPGMSRVNHGPAAALMETQVVTASSSLHDQEQQHQSTSANTLFAHLPRRRSPYNQSSS